MNALYRLVFFACLGLLTQTIPAQAHQEQVEPVGVRIRPQEQFFTAEFTGNVQDITQIPGVTLEDNIRGEFTRDQKQRLQDYVNERFAITQGGTPIPGALTAVEQESDLDPTRARFRMVLRYPKEPSAADAPFTITTTLFDYLPNARTIVTVGSTPRTLLPGQSTTIDPAAFATNLARTVWTFLVSGAEHIAGGPDHLLFILGLLIVSPSLKDLIKTLTGFTLAHSITLILSALSVITLPERLVEVFVALSIIYVGVENLFLKNTQRRIWIASAFGLVHGFAFAGNLREYGLPEGAALFWSLLSFNLGVELAQVVICAVAFPLLMWWKGGVSHRAKYGGMPWQSVVRVASMAVVVAGSYWLLQTVMG